MAARALARAGFKVLDVDALAKTLYQAGRPVYHKLRRVFGPKVILRDGRVDTAWLGREAFRHPGQLGKLNEIVFPALRKLLREELARLALSKTRQVALDMAVLFDAGAESLVDEVIVVDAPAKTRVARLVRERGLAEARARLQARAWKMPVRHRCRLVRRLKNNGSRGAFLDSLKNVL
jgi:dephospho-CoA kinase